MSDTTELRFYPISDTGRILIYKTGSYRLIAYVKEKGTIQYYPPITMQDKVEINDYLEIKKP